MPLDLQHGGKDTASSRSLMHFGTAKGEHKLDAHAWLDAAGIEVTGYPVAENFAEIACFV